VKPVLALKFKLGRRFVIGVPFVWLAIFFVLPFLILLRISITDMGGGVDPFAPLVDSAGGAWRFIFKYDNYAAIFRDAGLGRPSTWRPTRPR
jgi:putrescine transport system permease protein